MSNRLLLGLFALGVVACDGKDDKDTTDDTNTDDTVCDSRIDSIYPDGTEPVFYRTTLQIDFGQEEDDTTATITLADAGGTDVPGDISWSDDGETAWFDPTADLMPSTTYTLTVAYSCDRTATVEFTTSAVGAEIADPTTLVDRVYNVDFINSGRIVEPAGIEGLVRPLLADVDVALMVTPTGYTAPNLSMMGGIFNVDGTTYEQDVCLPTLTLDDADFSENPFFELSGTNTQFTILGFTIEIASLNLSGAFSPDASSLEGVALDLFIDTEQLADLDLGLDLGDQSICELVGSFGVACQDCGNGSVTCLKLVVDEILAEEQVGLTIDPIDEADIEGNPDCEDTDAE